MKKILLYILIIFAIFWFFSKDASGEVKAGFTPGDIFYSFDRGWEWVQLNILTFTEEGKIKLKIKFLNERLAELNELNEKRKLTQKRVEDFIDTYNALAEDINNNIKKAKETKKNIDNVLTELQAVSDKQKSIIQKVSSNTSGKTSEILSKIVNFGSDVFYKTEDILR